MACLWFWILDIGSENLVAQAGLQLMVVLHPSEAEIRGEACVPHVHKQLKLMFLILFHL